MIQLKPLIISIIIPLALGGIGSLLGGSTSSFSSIAKPWFAPPAFIFPIVWSILYILMGISSYLIYTSLATKKEKQISLTFYGIQLILNSLWTLFFFRLKLYFFSFIWILIIILFLIITMYKFYKIRPVAMYLQIPYLLWLIFASILSYNIYILN